MAKAHECISTVLGLGHLPVAPGTWGSLAGLLVCIVLHPYPIAYFAAFIILFTAGVQSSEKAEKHNGMKDPSYVVIDEFSSIFIVYAFLPMTVLNIVLGFLLFRVFDVIKPPPIRRIEDIKGGWGIMLDDIVAAAYSNLVLQVLRLFIR